MLPHPRCPLSEVVTLIRFPGNMRCPVHPGGEPPNAILVGGFNPFEKKY